MLWGSPEVKRNKRFKTHLPSLKCHAIFVLNPKIRFERCNFFPLPKAFITSWTTTKPNALAHLFQDCHLFPPSCQNLQLFLLATSTGQLLAVKKLKHIRSLTFGTAWSKQHFNIKMSSFAKYTWENGKTTLKRMSSKKKFQAIANHFYCKGFKTKLLVVCQHILPTCYIVHWKKRQLNPLLRYNY